MLGARLGLDGPCWSEVGSLLGSDGPIVELERGPRWDPLYPAWGEAPAQEQLSSPL